MKKLLVTLLIAVMAIAMIGCEPKPVEGETEKTPVTESGDKDDSELKEAPIVQAIGTVDDAEYQKAVNAFETIVKKMRTDGLVTEDDICVKMDDKSVYVDITFDNDDVDLWITKDGSGSGHTLTFDYNFIWLPEFGPTVNGKDPALYNKELLVAILSLVSDEPQVVFDRIDLDCFSAAGLSNTEWETVGDIRIMSGEMVVDEFISYKITK